MTWTHSAGLIHIAHPRQFLQSRPLRSPLLFKISDLQRFHNWHTPNPMHSSGIFLGTYRSPWLESGGLKCAQLGRCSTQSKYDQSLMVHFWQSGCVDGCSYRMLVLTCKRSREDSLQEEYPLLLLNLIGPVGLPYSIWVSTVGRDFGPTKEESNMKICPIILLLSLAASVGTMTETARSQSLPYVEGSAVPPTTVSTSELDLTYVRPTERTMANNYFFDAFGPYPTTGAALAAGINQWTDSPPEWHQGMKGYARRFGSDFGMAAVGTTTRYALSEAFREDTLYYRCECKGFFPRLSHAVLSTVTARHGEDGHRAFSFSSLLAPYTGSTLAVYGWYPGRFGAKDALRMGNYNLLAYMGGNVALEFLYSGPHSWLSRIHMNNAHGSPDPGPNH
jgi:hypothetical protein